MGDLLGDEGFRVAFGAALAAALAMLCLRRRVLLGGFAGAVAPVAAVAGLVVTDRDRMLSLAGLALVAIGALLGRHGGRAVTALAVLPGALVLAAGLSAPVPDWAAAVLVAAIAAAAPLAIEVGAGAPRVLPVLLALSALGMYATTPDTEHTRVLAGALLGAVLLVVDPRLRSSRAGVAATVALLTWATVIDGFPRRSAVVGGLACLGVAVLLPLTGRAPVPWRAVPVALVVGLQGAVVLVASRVAGLRSSAGAALAITAAAWVAALLLLRRMPRWSPPTSAGERAPPAA